MGLAVEGIDTPGAWARKVLTIGGALPGRVGSSRHVTADGKRHVPCNLRDPYDLVVAGGALYVSDSGHHRVLVFDCDGGLIRRIGDPVASFAQAHRKRAPGGGPPGCFQDPAGLAIADGLLYIAEAGGRRVQILTLEGSVRQVAAVPGDHAGDQAGDQAGDHADHALEDDLAGICITAGAACVVVEHSQCGTLHILRRLPPTGSPHGGHTVSTLRDADGGDADADSLALGASCFHKLRIADHPTAENWRR